MVFHLNHLIQNIHEIYPLINNTFIDRLINNILHNKHGIFTQPNTILYGTDDYLNRLYMYRLITTHFKITMINVINRTITTSINNIEIEYIENPYFIEINFDSQLTKEKQGYIDFIKSISSSKSICHLKRIVFLTNLDKLNNTYQSKLRTIIEKGSVNCLFLVITDKINNIDHAIVSRFMSIRISTLSSLQIKSFIFHNIQNDLNPKEMQLAYKNILKTLDKYNYYDNTNILNVFLYCCVYSMNNEDFSKNIGKNQMMYNELNTIITILKKNTTFTTLICKLRESIYKILHFNIDVNVFSKMFLKIVFDHKLFQDKKQKCLNIITKFNHDIITQKMKCFQLYEYLFIELYEIIHTN